ncbi:MAG: fibronectin type III domain-containing protein [Puniceicoccaceae bacterium]
MNPIWNNATSHAENWLNLGWFGWFKETSAEWIYHAEHGNQYVSGTSQASLFLYDVETAGWFWTSNSVYPYLYRFGTNQGWYWYYRNAEPGNRWFKRMSDSADHLETEMFGSAPNAPTMLNVSSITATGAVLTWRDQSDNESSFVVGRYLNLFPTGSLWSKFGEVPANTTQYTFSGLSPDTLYTVYVRAVNDFGFATSTSTAFRTLSQTVALAAPTNLTLTPLTLSSVQLDWDDNATSETAYHISFSTTGPSGPFTELPALPANTESEPLTQLSPCQTYWIKVRAASGNSYSDYSNTVSVNVDTTATIIFNNSAISPFSPSMGFPTYVGCWNSGTFTGGLAIFDDDGNGILDNESGSNSYVFPREAEQTAPLQSTWTLKAGRAFEQDANLVLFFRFSSWATYTRDQYIAVYLRVSNGIVTPVSMRGGDMFHPVNGLFGQEDGIVMYGAVLNNQLSIDYGQLPGAEVGVLQGSASAFMAFVAPALVNPTTYSADVYITFNVPIYTD